MALFVLAVNKGLCATFRTVFELMGFIDEQTVDTELFKGQRIVLSCLFELIRLFLQALTGTLHSLDLEL